LFEFAGTHSITGLIIVMLTFLIGWIRMCTFKRDLTDRHEPMYRGYDQVWIVVVLLGIICLYCGFYDYVMVDATVNVTSWYWIYGSCVGFWVLLFLVRELYNLRRHRIERQQNEAVDAYQSGSSRFVRKEKKKKKFV
jgi:hypothetical protein